jgi:hypothetical protein
MPSRAARRLYRCDTDDGTRCLELSGVRENTNASRRNTSPTETARIGADPVPPRALLVGGPQDELDVADRRRRQQVAAVRTVEQLVERGARARVPPLVDLAEQSHARGLDKCGGLRAGRDHLDEVVALAREWVRTGVDAQGTAGQLVDGAAGASPPRLGPCHDASHRTHSRHETHHGSSTAKKRTAKPLVRPVGAAGIEPATARV